MEISLSRYCPDPFETGECGGRFTNPSGSSYQLFPCPFLGMESNTHAVRQGGATDIVSSVSYLSMLCSLMIPVRPFINFRILDVRCHNRTPLAPFMVVMNWCTSMRVCRDSARDGGRNFGQRVRCTQTPAGRMLSSLSYF